MHHLSRLAGVALIGALSVTAARSEIETVEPEEVGLSSERLERIRPVIQKYVDRNLTPGFTTLVAREGKIAHFDTYGGRSLGASDMKDDTIFRIYSMSKPITSVAIMMLYEEGELLLSDPVSKYIPALGNMKVFVEEGPDGPVLEDPKRPMQIRDLLTHTAGIVYPFTNHPVAKYYGEAFPFDPQQEDNVYGMTLEAFVEKLGTLPLASHPGTEWHYGYNTDVLGRIVEVVSGQTLDVFFQERIFGPLNMVDTAFYVPEEKLERFTVLYQHRSKTDGGLQVVDGMEEGLYAKKAVPFLSGGGGLVSTTRDYLRFCQMLLNGGELDGARILGPRTIEYMTINHLPQDTPYITGSPGVGFGLGFSVTENPAATKTISSTGSFAWGGAAGTVFWIDPEEEMIVIGMRQVLSSPIPLRQEMHATIYQAIIE